jgi:hypothetical protein
MRFKNPKVVILILTGAFLLLFDCCQGDERAVKEIERMDYAKAIERDLHSNHWQTRFNALESAKAIGWQARDIVIQALSDRSDMISRLAQTWFIDNGEQAVGYLVQMLLGVEEDVGLSASIAGGKNRKRGQSIAGTIWMTLVRGLPRERCYELMKTLAHHDSPKVRAIVLFTAASLRSHKFLEFFDILADDRDPLIREKFREDLIRLLTLEWYSTPELDEPSVSHCLNLLESELTDILDSKTRFFDGILTLGEVLGKDVLPFHRKRFISLLEKTIPQLSEEGAARAGAAIERQCWIMKDRDKYPNSLWMDYEGGKIWDKDLIVDVYSRLLKKLRSENKKARQNYLAALSQFPDEIYDDRLAEIFFDSDLVQHKYSSHVAIRFYVKAIREKDNDLTAKALTVLKQSLAHPEDQNVLEALYAGNYALQSLKSQNSGQLLDLFKSYIDRIFSMIETANVKDLPTFLELFIHLKDDRYFQIFKQAWSHLHSKDLAFATPLSSCVGLISQKKDSRIIPYLKEYINEGSSVIYTGLKSICVSRLLNSFYLPLSKEVSTHFITDEEFKRWMAIIKDPEEHPRVRAAFVGLLNDPFLSEDRHRALVEAYFEMTRAPHHWNLRSKACWHLAKAGERRVLPLVYELLVSNGTPSWVPLNCLSAIYELEAEGKKTKEAQVKAGARKAVEVLETMLTIYPKPDPQVNVISMNLYHVYPPLMVLISLRNHTGQDFGYYIAAWKKWLKME